MANGPPDFRSARQATGILLILLACALTLLDAVRTDYEVNLFVLVAILLTGAAMFAVDVPGLGSLTGLFGGTKTKRKDEDNPDE